MKRIFLPYCLCIFLPVLAVQPIAAAANETLYDYDWNMPAMTIAIPEGWGGDYKIRHYGVGDWDLALFLQDSATGQWIQKFPQQDFVYYELKGAVPPDVANGLAATRMSKPISAAEVIDVFLGNRTDADITIQGKNLEEAALLAMKENMRKAMGTIPT